MLQILSKTCLFLLAITFTFSLSAQYTLEWEQSFGATYVTDIYPTLDGGYIVHSNKNLLSKIDANGNLLWEESYIGEPGLPTWFSYVMTPISDNGYAIAGGDFSVLKTDANGMVLWEESYSFDYGYEQPSSGFGYEIIRALAPSEDGGLFVGGLVGDPSAYYPEVLRVLHLDAEGNLLWESNVYGVNTDAVAIEPTSDGGCMVLAVLGGNVFFGGVATDFHVLKLDADGEIEWQENYGDGNINSQFPGGLEFHMPRDMVKTEEGDFLLAGYKEDLDGWLLKINDMGEILWEQTFENIITAVDLTPEGDIVVVGQVSVPGTGTGTDYWVARLDTEGNLLWESSYGGSSTEYAYALLAHDDGLFVGGRSSTFPSTATEEAWLIKLREIENTITAHTFHDENGNGALDEGEQPLLNQTITLNPTALSGLTNGEGNTTFYVDAGSYTLNYENNNPLWELGSDIQATIEIPTDIDLDTTIYYPMVPIGDFLVNQIDVSSSITRCNQHTNVWLTYSNTGTLTNSGVAALELDSLSTFVSSNPPADSTNGNYLYWFYEDLAPSYSDQVQVIVTMPGVEALGSEIEFTADVQSNDGQGYNKAIYDSELICAYNPNDKLVTPEGEAEEHYTLFGDTLAYTIRFQNTGNDTAFTVVVQDTLSEYLDINSFRSIASSHSVETMLDFDSRIVTFTFTDIYLADSFVNEPASHGFVKFEIQTIDDIAENTLVENNASIYFDFNPPIVTNTVYNTFVSQIPGGFDVSIKLFLEGCYDGNGMMRTDLTEVMPLNQPYGGSPWNYSGTESITIVPANMVDWVLVEARTGSPITGELGTAVIEQHAGLLLSDGSIVGVDAPLRFVDLEESTNYYFSVRHRNHLDVLSATPIMASASMTYDFTTEIEQAFGPAQQKLSMDGTPVLYAGDMTADGTIQVTDYDVWFDSGAILNTYHPADLTMDKVVQVTDYDVWFFNKAKIGVLELQY